MAIADWVETDREIEFALGLGWVSGESSLRGDDSGC
jgi:hypothetical protein